MLRRLCVFAAALAAVSCSGGSSSSNSSNTPEDAYTIPEKVELDAKLFPVITDTQFIEAKELLNAIHSLNSLREHILVDPGETDRSKENRDLSFAKLTTEQKAAVLSINSRCQLSDEPADPKTLSSELNMIEELRTVGPDCPALLSDRTHLRWTVLNTDAKGESGAVRIYVHNILQSIYNEDDLARAAGASRFSVELVARGRMEIEPESSRTFARVTGGGSAELVNPALGHMDIRLKGEYLDKDDTRELVLYVNFSIKEKTHSLAFHCYEDADGLIKVDRFVIGNRELNAEEREAAGVNDLARILLN
ncbi:MAG: hypothetical protein KF799_06285 [Bdellovibrionales bacterium]|nr:hypothetical protein [Bdellovibrionales bacterium]